MSSIYYTGIGARKTPADITYLMTELADALDNRGWTLRSGGADGADLAFEKGAGEDKHIFLPWNGFNDSPSLLFNIPDQAFKVAEKIHPSWGSLSQGAKKMHARNVLQITGKFMKVKSKFVVCWTPKGAKVGGTATAIKLAEMLDIKVFNLYSDDPKEVLDYALQYEA
jgi:hypothetical protein